MQNDQDRLIHELFSYVTPAKQEKMKQVVRHRTRHVTVMIEDIFQPHNANAILRTCELFGVQDVHIVEQSNKFRVVSAIAMGAAKWLDLHRYTSSSDAVGVLKRAGYRIVATVPSKQAVSIDQISLDNKLVLIFGTEEQGIMPETMQHVDEYVTIPMYGFTQSFNVSVSVALCVHSIISRLQHHTVEWRLNPQEQHEVLLCWLKRCVPAYAEVVRRLTK